MQDELEHVVDQAEKGDQLLAHLPLVDLLHEGHLSGLWHVVTAA